MSTTDEQQLLPCERWITERDLALRQTHGETRMRAEFNDHYGTIESTADANRAFFEFEAGWQRALAAVSEPAAPVDARDAESRAMFAVRLSHGNQDTTMTCCEVLALLNEQNYDAALAHQAAAPAEGKA